MTLARCLDELWGRRRLLVTLVLMGLVGIAFRSIISADWAALMAKYLGGWDESTNAVVAANNTRHLFPPMLRLASLYPQVQGWSDGPYWQHIPPLFTYVPWLSFVIDGGASIEVFRLSFAFVALATALTFILIVTRTTGSLRATFAAGAAAILWLASPITRNLVTGSEFGTSDLALALGTVLAFGALVSYQARPVGERTHLSWRRLALLIVLTSLPVLIKSALGGIAPLFGFLLLLRDRRRVTKDVVIYLAGVLLVVGAQDLALYLSSPATFRHELLEPLRHVTQSYENWGRPWHTFLTDYLPFHYVTFGRSPAHRVRWVVGVVLFLAAVASFAVRSAGGQSNAPQGLALSWFALNLLVVSLIRSKAPNFIFQSWLLALFFGIDSLLCALPPVSRLVALPFSRRVGAAAIACGAIFFPIRATVLLSQLPAKLHRSRAAAEPTHGERARFYQFAEYLRASGYGLDTLFLIKTGGDDVFFRYPVLFLTGAEARTADELLGPTPVSTLRSRYERIGIIQAGGSAPAPVGGVNQVHHISGFDLTILSTRQLSESWIEQHRAFLEHLPGMARLLHL